jgi:hypothetical protein
MFDDAISPCFPLRASNEQPELLSVRVLRSATADLAVDEDDAIHDIAALSRSYGGCAATASDAEEIPADGGAERNALVESLARARTAHPLEAFRQLAPLLAAVLLAALVGVLGTLASAN